MRWYVVSGRRSESDVVDHCLMEIRKMTASNKKSGRHVRFFVMPSCRLHGPLLSVQSGPVDSRGTAVCTLRGRIKVAIR